MQVKGLTATGVKAGTASQQQLRQFTIQHQLLQQRKAQQQQQQQSKTSQLAQVETTIRVFLQVLDFSTSGCW